MTVTPFGGRLAFVEIHCPKRNQLTVRAAAHLIFLEVENRLPGLAKFNMIIAA